MKHSISEQIKATEKARLFISAARDLIKIVAHYKVGGMKAPLFSVEAKAFSKCTNLLSDDISDNLDSILNDAGSTLAALNLTKDLPEKEEYFEHLEDAFVDFFQDDERLEASDKNYILAMSYDRLKLQEDRIKELEEALKGVPDILDKFKTAYTSIQLNSMNGVISVMAAGIEDLTTIKSLLKQ